MIIDYRNKKINPLLSVCIVTYNQKDYIAKAVDSVLAQITDYPFEVLIGDDCSDDGTREVLLEYQKKYPELFFYFPEVNTYHTDYNLFKRLEDISRGRYINYLEGDDFWINENKIDLQLKFLLTHPDYLGVAGKCIVVDKYSNPSGVTYPECKVNEYQKIFWYSGIVPGQTATFMFVNRKYHPEIDWSLIDKSLSGPGDKLRYYLLALHGKIWCLDDIVSAYRFVKDEGISFSATYNFSYSRFNSWYEAIVQYAYTNGDEKDVLLSEVFYYVFILRCAKRRQVTLRSVIIPKYHRSGILKIYFTFLQQQFSHFVLKKTLYVK